MSVLREPLEGDSTANPATESTKKHLILDKKHNHMLATLTAALEEAHTPHKVHLQPLSLDCMVVTVLVKYYHSALQEIGIQCSRREQVVELR